MEGGKWGLVIIFTAFMIQVLAFGVTSTIGVYNIEFLDYFDGATVGVSLIGSINYGVFLGSGPIVSFLMTKFTYRKIALFGSVLIVIGLLGMPLLPYLPAMCVCFGLLVGFGSCCTYIPSHVLSGLYYDKHRSLATGVATSGSGLGGAVMPVITGVLIEHYSWKGSLIFVAGLCLHLFVFSALLRDPPPVLMMQMSIIEPDKKEAKTCETVALIKESYVGKENSDGMLHHDNHDNYIIQLDVDKQMPGSYENIHNPKLENSSPPSIEANGCLIVRHEKSLGDSTEDGTLIPKQKSHCAAILSNEHSLSITSLHSAGCIRGASQVVVDSSIAFQSSKSVHESTNVTNTLQAKNIPKSSRHIYIFTHYGFNVYFASNIMWNAGTAIVNAFVPEFLTEKGLLPMEAAWYTGVFGFGCFLGGIFGGVFGNFRWVNRQVLYTASNIVMGVSLIAFPYFEQRSLYLVHLIISGGAFGIILGLLIVVLTDLIGVESLGNGLGYLMLSNGLGTFIGPPVAGLLKEATGGFKESIVLSGALCVLGGLIMFLMPCKWNCCTRNKFK